MLSQLNENWREDGVFERQRVYLQSVRGDVAWVIENNPNAATPIEQMTYDMWGVPGLLSRGADLDDDGDITNGLRPDGGVTIDDPTVFLELYEDGHAGADVDDGSGLGLKDGGVTVDDLVLYLAWFEGGATGSVDDNRFLYRGYWWDPVLEMYHVRHRVYDPKSHRFLQPDPLGTAAGRNVYAYCEGDPVNCYDPYGLDAWLIGAPFRGTWAGERIDNAVDGMIELVGAISGANANSDAAHGREMSRAQDMRSAKVIEAVSSGQMTVEAARHFFTGDNAYAAAESSALLSIRRDEARQVVESAVAAAVVALSGGAGGGFAGTVLNGGIIGAKMSLYGQLVSYATGLRSGVAWDEVATSGAWGVLLGAGGSAAGKLAQALSPRINVWTADAAFHYTQSPNVGAILDKGLHPGSFATTAGGLSPLEALLYLALNPAKGLRNGVVRIDLNAMRKAGYTIPTGRTVKGQFGQPGGGCEIQFPYRVPPDHLSPGQ